VLPRQPHLRVATGLLRGDVLRLDQLGLSERRVLPDEPRVRELNHLLPERDDLRAGHAGVLPGGALLPRQPDLLSERHGLR
jgi:hypothetical protein